MKTIFLHKNEKRIDFSIIDIIIMASRCIILKKIKKSININEVDINKIFLSNKSPYGEQGS